MNQDIEEVIAERVLLPPFIVQRKTQARYVTVANIGGIGKIAWSFYSRGILNMSFVIALERRVQSVGIDEKDNSGDGKQNAESVQPG
jgi:hypothetical protein